MPFEFVELNIPDVLLIKPKVFGDSRGYFMETYKYSDFSQYGITQTFNQDNFSKSQKGVLRGLHFQKNPVAQAKIVRCVYGEILDVAVDIRENSPYFGKWVSAELTDKNNAMMYVPEGFAHGFLVLSNEALLAYKTSNEYSPSDDSGILWNDPHIGIDWGIDNPLISDKDKSLPLLKNADINFKY